MTTEKNYKSRDPLQTTKKKREHAILIVGLYLALFSITGIRCRETPQTAASTYTFVEPAYSNINLMPVTDSLQFPLSESTYNEIKSFNYFEDNNLPFISFYDRRSQSICIYDFSSMHRVKKVRLKKCFEDQNFYKTSVYVRNFDSIFVTNQGSLYLIDSSGEIKADIDFSRSGRPRAFFENSVPVVFKNNTVYMGVRPSLDETSGSAVRNWRVVYSFNIAEKKRNLHYSLPQVYLDSFYNDHFFSYSYCINDKGNFVFSFPADTNIYETNLTDYHVAYYGKSRRQTGPIQSVSKESFEKDEGGKEYSLRDTYGAMYYDPYTKRYLRLARQRISESEYERGVKRKQSIIIFNKDFKIIGETDITGDFLPNSIFFTGDGKIYARTKVNDENTLHFVRLEYLEIQDEKQRLADNKLSQ